MNQPSSSHAQAIRLAQRIIAKKPIFLDTETTGLDKKAEIIEIAIIEHDGTLLYQSLIKPLNSDPSATRQIHGITVDLLKGAKPWPFTWNDIRGLVFGRIVGIYNAEFDLRMIDQTNSIYHIPKHQLKTFDIMTIFAQYRGNWSSRYQSYQSYKQEDAARYCGIYVKKTHRAMEDAFLARNILFHIAKG